MFFRRYWDVLDLIERINSEFPFKIRYSDKIYLFSRYTDVCLCGTSCFLGRWYSVLSLVTWQGSIHSGLVNRGVRLNNLTSWEVHMPWIYYLHQNTSITVRINLFLSLVNWPGKKTVFCENNIYIKQCRTMPSIWRLGKNEHLIYRISPSCCFCTLCFPLSSMAEQQTPIAGMWHITP